jgi:hypothetical protein
MEDQMDKAQAPPKQSFIEQQLGAAITPAAEREKLSRSFDAFCEELDAQGEAAPEPVKAPPGPVAVEAVPVEQAVRQIALQPAPRPADPDPLDAQARQFEIWASVTRHPDFKRERIATQRAYEECVREMSRHYDVPEEEVKAKFTDPLLKDFTPDQLSPEWFQEQVNAMKAPEVVKRKVEQKWAEMMLQQERQNKTARELVDRYDADQQQRANQNWQAAIMAEARTQLDEEKEFAALKNIRDRANTGDATASAQFNDLEQNVFRPYMVKLMTEHPNTPPGQATRKALRHIKEYLQGKGRKQTASPASQPSHSTPSSSPPSHKPLGKNSRASLDEAFARWVPPAKEDSYWDSATNSYKRRER